LGKLVVSQFSQQLDNAGSDPALFSVIGNDLIPDVELIIPNDPGSFILIKQTNLSESFPRSAANEDGT
jgi:hypothetical protein